MSGIPSNLGEKVSLKSSVHNVFFNKTVFKTLGVGGSFSYTNDFYEKKKILRNDLKEMERIPECDARRMSREIGKSVNIYK